MASSAALRLMACRPVARLAAVRPLRVAAEASVFGSRVQIAQSRSLFTSIPRFSFEKLNESDQSEVRQRTMDIVKNFHKIDAERVTEDAKFIEDLGLDSLDAVEIVMALEDEFDIEISDEEAERVATIRIALDIVAEKVAAK